MRTNPNGNDREMSGIRSFVAINLQTRTATVSSCEVYRSCGLEAQPQTCFRAVLGNRVTP